MRGTWGFALAFSVTQTSDAKSSVDDLGAGRGVVHGRAVPNSHCDLLRLSPSNKTGRFVLPEQAGRIATARSSVTPIQAHAGGVTEKKDGEAFDGTCVCVFRCADAAIGLLATVRENASVFRRGWVCVRVSSLSTEVERSEAKRRASGLTGRLYHNSLAVKKKRATVACRCEKLCSFRALRLWFVATTTWLTGRTDGRTACFLIDCRSRIVPRRS